MLIVSNAACLLYDVKALDSSTICLRHAPKRTTWRRWQIIVTRWRLRSNVSRFSARAVRLENFKRNRLSTAIDVRRRFQCSRKHWLAAWPGQGVSVCLAERWEPWSTSQAPVWARWHGSCNGCTTSTTRRLHGTVETPWHLVVFHRLERLGERKRGADITQ